MRSSELSGLIKSFVFNPISWFILSRECFSLSECSGCCGGTERGAAAFSDGKSPIGELNELKEKISKRGKNMTSLG